MSNEPCFIWIGAGEAKDTTLLDQFLDQHPNGRVVLVEARYSSYKKLKKKFDNNQFVITHNALDVKSLNKKFYFFNVPEFSGFERPKDLALLFPGIIIEKVVEIKTSDLCVYIDSLNLELESNNQIYIDLPGLCYPFLCCLYESEKTKYFSDIHILNPKVTLYENSAKSTVLNQYLFKIGYDVFEINSEDPDIPIISCKKNYFSEKYILVEKENQNILKVNEELVHQKEEKERVISEQIVDLKKKSLEILDLKEECNSLKCEVQEKKKVLEALRLESEFLGRKVADKEAEVSGLENKNKNYLKELEVVGGKVLELSKKNEKQLAELSKKDGTIEEQNYRNRMLELEITKLEAQLDLIKDVILREKVF
ncbi:hypothetical protein OW491_15730 [Neptunomonas sp. CHC150]|uniref:hypothetical protein n=1 Tax=Neptunomonas sp. CHC150 TaxID=2998324 RepID=UPI0025B1D3BA|nr:hypothetical protein [Neptunomonas sp. CHC150]MDN2661262.1 hypothetical protein [Neptunomonas sp. CHC150]